MKKLVSVSLAAFMALMMASNANATANDVGNQSQALCDFGQRVMKNAGYNPQSTYTSEGIRQIFNNINVNADLSGLNPRCTYRLAYNCKEDHKLANASLDMIPVESQYNQKMIVANWKFSKPLSVVKNN